MENTTATKQSVIYINQVKNLYLKGDESAIPNNIYIDQVENLYTENPKPDVARSCKTDNGHTLTNSQLALASHFVFKSLGFYSRVNVDMALIARFIHLLADKPYTKIHNSDFYKKLKKAPNFKADRELIKDLELVKIELLKVDFKEAALLVEKEILIARQEISHRA